MAAAYKGYTDLIRFLIEKGADINPKVEVWGSWTPLMKAACSGQVESVRLLLEKGAAMNPKMSGGWTAFTFAIRGGHFETVKLLVEKGADVNEERLYGETALMVAASEGELETARFLVEKGANVNARALYGQTALMHAIGKGWWESLWSFLDGAGEPPVDAKEQSRRTAFKSAIRSRKSDLVRFLVERGADVNAKNKYGETALSLTQNPDFKTLEEESGLTPKQEDFTQIVEFLKAHGAKE